MNKSTPTEVRARENQSKFIQDRITQVEKYFGELCSLFGVHTRRSSKLRDTGDSISKTILEYSENESHNHTAKSSLTQFAECLAAVQDYRNAQVKRLEAHVVDQLTLYGTTCKHAREDIKAAFVAHSKEVKTQKQLDKVIEKHPSDRHQISQAETEHQKASVDASWTSKALEEKMDAFEKQKLRDIKKILCDFVSIEMMFHAKTLENYTLCYQSLQQMSEDEDLEEFRNSLHPPNTASRLEMQRTASKSSLNSTQQSALPSRPTPTTPHRPITNNMYGEDDDEDDYDDEDETDEEDADYNQPPQPGARHHQPGGRYHQPGKR